MNALLRSASVIALALGATACQTPVPQVLAPQHVPSNFTAPTAQGAPVWPAANWWAGFGSPELNGFVTTAQTNNLDLAAAAARVLQAEAQTEISGSALFPSLSLQGSAQRARNGTGQLVTNAQGVPIGTKAATGNSFGLTGNASYEIDFWGKNRAALRAADQLLLASTYARQVVALTVTTDVATTYLDVLALRERLAIARQNVAAARRILKIVEAKVTNGVSSRLDLAQQQATLAGIEATIPALEEQERESRYALAILLGRLPEGFDVTATTLNGIVTPQVAPGLTSELLRRRPDVAQAEANLASAHANVDAARAAFFPSIGLTGSTGFASTALSSLFTGGGFGWSIGASLLQTIFDGGLLEGQYELSKGQQQELVATYQSTVLNAFSDVETTLGQVSSLADQERLRTEQTRAAAEAFRISELQYREGVTDLLNVLTAQQVLFSAQDTLVQIKLARIQSDVGLYKALGGGWSEVADAATQAIPATTTPVKAGPPASVPPPNTAPVPATPLPTDIPGSEPDKAAPPPRR
ncbi:MAG: efflux transporter outer membrane subunit [Alphaproteobacteria bacterium]|nr:efflux transporter outer membrane subunit [Alphaproteobacteria bacterium]